MNDMGYDNAQKAKKYLKGKEEFWESYWKVDTLEYMVVTKNILREMYYLYKIENGKRIEVAKNTNPNQFYDYIYKSWRWNNDI